MHASRSVIAGTLLIDSKHARVLFDPGATQLFTSLYFALRLGREPEYLESPLSILTPVGSALVTNRVIHSCNVLVGEYTYPVDLILVDLLKFDVILGMD